MIATLKRRHIVLGGCLALLVLIGLAEATARQLGFGHPLLYRASASGYEVVPDQTISRMGKVTHINVLGTRGPDATRHPAFGTIRILSLGDSVANGGSQVNDENTYPSLLQAEFLSHGCRVEVLNASAGGWAIGNEERWLRAHGLLNSSIVILEVNDFDLDQLFVGYNILSTNPAFPSQAPATALGETLSRYVLPRLGLTGPSADPGSTNGDFKSENLPIVLGYIRRIAETVKREGGKLVILFWDSRANASRARSAAGRKLIQTARMIQTPVFRPRLNAHDDSINLFRDAIHPSVSGNALIAQGLQRFLRPLHSSLTRCHQP